MKMFALIVGMAAGAAAASSWLLSTPDDPAASAVPTNSSTVQARVAVLKAHVERARADGQRASKSTEEQLRRTLVAYRKTGSRPGAESSIARSLS